ncbi:MULTISPECIES: DUF1343 domain-containing protein [Kosmotoga]|uniref:DUF1343 domain-containing protein n=1 Tax=Kosmotoga olearia (strain ATCC BAA-1733 / DSM 21960 / TBF 19.5.1) TaxID=521045 RepID=C5CH67_KOSOT|nr:MULTISPECIES: DUF1343 domain-containing protein [Kosmotoga]ACR80670.1 conserved hypothetical protein [Kosmotoga olearia TBF 19.5.1]MDI3495363.1 hypothetical protein [Pseudothermotoga sp.]OAA19118.1 hypothetical protein DU53_10865 [Kosmotoga sp. DU53]
MILQGIDVLEKNEFRPLRRRKVGLITNYSFVTKDMRQGLDVLIQNNINVVKIFTPEHGLYGLPDGETFNDTLHPKYKIPVISLYGKKKKPESNDLEDIDILVYDIQDVGLRYYTFIYTLAYTLEAASENGIDYLVLDRINPLGRKVYGPRIPDKLSSFVGDYLLPTRYGLTPGELAQYFLRLKKLDLELKVIPLEGWGGEGFNQTDLLWNVPSPALPTYEATLCYAGICFLEATNVSEGRGTPKPFQYIGAPWVDNDELYEFLKDMFPNLILRKREFIPRFGKYAQQLCFGVEFFPKFEDNFFEVSISLLHYLSKYPEMKIDKHISRLMGDELALEIATGKTDVNVWRKSAEEFIDTVSDLLIYGGNLYYDS